MGQKRGRPRKFPNSAIQETPSPNRLPQLTFQTLISAIQEPQCIKLPLLKRLYALVVPLSSMEPIHWSNTEGSIDYFGIDLKLEDLQRIIHCLFKELEIRLDIMFSALSDMCTNRAHEHGHLDKDEPVAVDELTLLLRCCMSLTLVDPSLVIEKTQYLHSVLGKLFNLATSGCHEKLISCKGTYVFKDSVASLCFLDASNPWRLIICAMLENDDVLEFQNFNNRIEELEEEDDVLEFQQSNVYIVLDRSATDFIGLGKIFADELVIRRQLRKYFVAVDSASCKDERLFNNFVKSDIGSVLEVISTHFILSVYDEPAFERFLKRLHLQCSKHFQGPELSLTAALPLLLDPIMLSVPKMLQTHLVLLVSEAIGIDYSWQHARPDPRLTTYYLTAFERSIVLYTSHMSGSLNAHHPLGINCSHPRSCMQRSYRPSFESCIQQDTRDNVYDRVTHLESLRLLTKSDLMDASTAYVNENQHFFDESCKDDILSVLHSIICGNLSSDVNDKVFLRKEDTGLQDICLIASILNLMSSSLLKAIWCLRNGESSGYLRTIKDDSLLKIYEFVVDTIGCFIGFNISLPNQKLLSDMMKTRPMMHKTSKWMLLHFLGLLSLSFAGGIEFLVKGCISIIMAILNLCAFEEGGIGALRSLFDSVTRSASCEPDMVKKAVKKRNMSQVMKKNISIRKVASKFQNIQNVYLSKPAVTRCHKKAQGEVGKSAENARTREFTDDMQDESEEICNGVVYLKSKLGGSQKSDIDDLADFIVCKPGKEYSSWMKDIEKYRSFKGKKTAVLRWEKKKMTYRKLRNQRN